MIVSPPPPPPSSPPPRKTRNASGGKSLHLTDVSISGQSLDGMVGKRQGSPVHIDPNFQALSPANTEADTFYATPYTMPPNRDENDGNSNNSDTQSGKDNSTEFQVY